MRKITFLKSLLLLCALMAGVGSAWGQSLTVDFESEASAYTDWTFTNIDSKQTNSNVTAHGGSYFGNTGGKMTASMMTKNKIASPKSITFYVSKQSTNTTDCSWKVETSSDGEEWNQVGDVQSASSMAKGTWVEVTRDLTSYSNVYVRISYGSNTAVRCIDDVTLSYIDEGKENVTLSFPKATYTADLADGVNSFDAPTATATPSVSPIIYMSSNTAVATVDENTGAVTLVKKGETKIIASFAGNDDYNSAEASYTLTVNNSNANDGSESKPFTVEEAIENTPASGTSDNYYIKGVVSAFYGNDIMDDGTNYRYYISDDGTTANQLLVFKGKGLGNVAFSNADDLLIGDEVVILGGLTTYNSTKEIASGNYIVSRKTKEDPILIVEDVEMFVEQEKALTDLYLIDDDYAGTVTFSSSDNAVATIAGDKLQAVAVGTATITVSATADAKYKAASETFTVTVKSRDVAPEGAGAGASYVLVTDASSLAEGDKMLIVGANAASTEFFAMAGQESNYRAKVDVTVADGIITQKPNTAQEVILEGTTDAWYFNVGEDAYLYAVSSSSNHLMTTTKETAGDNGKAKIEIGEKGAATVTFQGEAKRNLLRYNQSSPRFSCYGSGQSAVYFYRYTETTTFDIEMGAAGWRTLVSAQDVTLPEGLTAYVVTANDGGSATLATAGSVKANTPYILNGDEGTYTLTMALGVTAPASNLLKISDESTGNGVYVLYNGTQGVGFYKWYGGSLGAGRVYLPATAGAPEFIALGGETTGIDMVQGSSIKVQDPEIYNLAGQRVARPTKGLYIVNGKKVVIR